MEQKKITVKCLYCGKEFECGYAANMHVLNDECVDVDLVCRVPQIRIAPRNSGMTDRCGASTAPYITEEKRYE